MSKPANHMSRDEFRARHKAKTKKHKYNAKRKTYKGITYPSIAQADYAEKLDLELLCGDIIWWSPEAIFQLTPDDRYQIDFQVQYISGEVEGIEVKGFETPKFKRNKRLWKKYGPFDLRIVKKGVADEIVQGNPAGRIT